MPPAAPRIFFPRIACHRAPNRADMAFVPIEEMLKVAMPAGGGHGICS
jgi:hypothetical protein